MWARTNLCLYLALCGVHDLISVAGDQRVEEGIVFAAIYNSAFAESGKGTMGRRLTTFSVDYKNTCDLATTCRLLELLAKHLLLATCTRRLRA